MDVRVGRHHVEVVADVRHLRVGALQVLVVIAGEPAEEDLRRRVGRPDRRCHGAEHPRVLGRVRAGRPRCRKVRLVPDLVGLDLPDVAVGKERHELGQLGVVARRRALVGPVARPARRLLDHHDDPVAGPARQIDRTIEAAQCGTVVRVVTRLDPVRPADARTDPLGPHAPKGGRRPVLRLAADAPGEVRHDAGLGGLRSGRRDCCSQNRGGDDEQPASGTTDACTVGAHRSLSAPAPARSCLPLQIRTNVGETCRFCSMGAAGFEPAASRANN